MSLKEFKEKNRKTITTTNGLEVVVRRMPAFALMKFGPIPRLEEAPADKQAQVTERILETAVISPKIGEGEDELSLNDLPWEDLNDILSAITGFEGQPETGGEPEVEGAPLEGTG